MIALVTSTAAAAHDDDLPLLVAALDEIGETTLVCAWDDPAVAWSEVDIAVIRSTWDYSGRHHEYLAWARATAAVTALWNPVEMIEWNTDKRYLDDLARRGVPVVPSVFVATDHDGRDAHDGRHANDGCTPAGTASGPTLVELLAGDVVVKPTVGAGSNGVGRFRGDPDAARAHLADLHAAGATALVQPYLAEVDERGETGLVYLGGRFSHAFTKRAILADEPDFASGLFATEDITATVAIEAERALADRVVAALPPTAYARVDLLPTAAGPVVSELELTEPSLFLVCDPGAAARAAEVFAALAARARTTDGGRR